MQPASATYNYNIVRDWNKLQGVTSPTDLSYTIQRDLNTRHVTIENSSPRCIGVAIESFYMSCKDLPIRFVMRGGEIRDLGINPIGGPQQYLYFIDPQTKRQVGHPAALQWNSDSYVLRDGLNGWFVQYYSHPSYRAAF